MLKKTITYTNPFTNDTVTEDHYFHISKADLIEMEVSQPGGMEKYLEKIIASEDGKAIMVEFKAIIHRSYGQKDGDRFIKSERIWEEFVSSEAYSTLFFELCTDAEAAASFVSGIIPSNLEQEAAKIAAKAELVKSETEEDDPTGLTKTMTPRILTRGELAEMDSDELQSGLAAGRYKLV